MTVAFPLLFQRLWYHDHSRREQLLWDAFIYFTRVGNKPSNPRHRDQKDQLKASTARTDDVNQTQFKVFPSLRAWDRVKRKRERERERERETDPCKSHPFKALPMALKGERLFRHWVDSFQFNVCRIGEQLHNPDPIRTVFFLFIWKRDTDWHETTEERSIYIPFSNL